MKPATLLRIAALAVAASLVALIAAPALAQAPTPPPAPTPNKGDTAWMLTASALVLLMTIPGLALFYCGLVRTKNGHQHAHAGVHHRMPRLHPLGGLRLQPGLHATAGVQRLGRRILQSVPGRHHAGYQSRDVHQRRYDPEYAYTCFQMTFAAITPALIVGSMAERMKFSAIVSSSRCG